LWCFVHVAANSVSHKIPNYGKTPPFSTLLHSMGDIGKAITDPSLLDALKESFLCGLQQELNPGADFTHWIGPGTVAAKTIDKRSNIYADY
jgi:hypothetical protein